jgi:homoserine dehydrogenase
VLRYDAAVAGAVPVTGTVADLARIDRIHRITGVLNGTANHVLSAAADFEFDVAAAVADASQRGYAESDPTRDLDGTDTADKLVILARLAWGATCSWARLLTTGDVDRRGLEVLTRDDLAVAHAAGAAWRLVAEATDDGILRVAPRQLPREHPLASVHGPRNVVEIEATMAGRLTLAGEGAGGEATASAVLRDVDALVTPWARR